MVKKYTKQLNSLSNTKRGGQNNKKDLNSVIKTVDNLKSKLEDLQNLSPHPTLQNIIDKKVLQEFNTMFITYLNKIAQITGNQPNEFKPLFGKKNDEEVKNGDNINDILYSRLINGIALTNNTNFPTTQQANYIKKNNNFKKKVCSNIKKDLDDTRAKLATQAKNTAEAELADTKKELAAKANLDAAKAELADTKKELAAAKKKISEEADAKLKLATIKQDLVTQKKRLDHAQKELSKAKNNLITAPNNAAKKRLLDEAQKRLVEAQKRLTAAKKRLAAAQAAAGPSIEDALQNNGAVNKLFNPPHGSSTDSTLSIGSGKKTTKKRKSTSTSSKKKSTSTKKKSTKK